MAKHEVSHDCDTAALSEVPPPTLDQILQELIDERASGPCGPVDIQTALARLHGNWELFRVLLAYFFEDAPPLLEKISAAAHHQDAGALQHGAHQFRGLVVNFNADGLANIALGLEKMGQKGDLAGVHEKIDHLQQELKRVMKVLHRFCPPSD